MKTIINKINHIKSEVNRVVRYASQKDIQILPTRQDILNIREFVPIAIRQYRITRLGNKIHRLQQKKDRLVDINIREFMDNLQQPQSIEM